MEPKGNLVELSTFLKYDITEFKKSYIVDVRFGSRCTSMNIPLYLTYLEEHSL